MSDGQEARYKVTFLGPVRNDLTTVNTLAEGLKERFKLSDEAAAKVMGMAPVAIKSGATLSEAKRYKEILEALGAKVQIDPIEKPQEALPEESPQPLNRAPQVVPVKTKSPPSPAESGESSGTETQTQMITCPQCGHVQEQTDECVKCGVIISKFLKYQEEVNPGGSEGVPPGPATGILTTESQPRSVISTPREKPTGYGRSRGTGTIKKVYLDWHGRICRKTYWIYSIPLALIYLLSYVFIEPVSEVLFILILLALDYSSFMINIKRSHDRGRTGWFTLLLLIPIISFWPLIEFGFLKGTEDDNKYGAPDDIWNK